MSMLISFMNQKVVQSGGNKGRKRKRTFGVAVENEGSTQLQVHETKTKKSVLIDITNWKKEHRPFGDVLVGPSGQVLLEQCALDEFESKFDYMSKRT